MSKVVANERGVTLIEAMIYMAMAGMLLATAVTAFLGQNKSYNRQDVIAEIQQNIRGATEMMIADIRFAGLGLIDETEGPFEIADHDEIAINIWDEDANDAVTVRYTLNGTDLMRQYGSEASAVIAENIEHLRFNYLFDNDPEEPEEGNVHEDWEWRVSAEDIYETNDLDTEAPDSEEEATEIIRAVKIVFLGGSRPASFSPTDGSTYNPDIEIETIAGYASPPWAPPHPREGYKRMVSVVAQCRNNIE